jgi:hypothetical protein
MGCGRAAHGDDCAGTHVESISEPYPSLYPYLHIDAIQGLNEREPGTSKHVFKSHDQRDDRSLFVESMRNDPQLILSVPLIGSAKIMGISISGGGPVEHAPSRLRLFVNRTDLDFSNIESAAPTQEISLARDQDPLYYPLRYGIGLPSSPTDSSVRTLKFTNVHHLTLFFPDSFNHETLRLFYINLHGIFSQVFFPFRLKESFHFPLHS